MVSPLVLPMKDPKWAKLYWTLVLARYARWSGQSAIDRTNLRKRIRVRGRVRVRLWERLRGRRAFASNADFAGIEAIDQSGQHCHDALEHLFTGANPIVRDKALRD